jgi:WD40 repeat protein
VVHERRLTDAHHPSPLSILTGHTNDVRSVAFSPDGHTLATGSFDHTARLWNVSDARHPSALGTLTGHTSDVRSVAFSLDGHALATGSFDDTARLWETSVDRVTARFCGITPVITPSEWDDYLPSLAYRLPCS